MNRDPFITDSIYHVYNRGTDKRTIFLSIHDRQRFMSNLYEFNDSNPALNWKYKAELSEVRPRKKVVEILAYCLMPNHYHLMLRQITDGGITLFMRKLGTGYTMYFNTLNNRSGALFQGKFKSVGVERDTQLRYLPHYIHANPLEGLGGEPISQLGQYSFSSAPAYLGRNHYDIITDTEFISSLYPEGYEAALKDWLTAQKTEDLAGVTLD
jgi:putative transposase